jgi:hypothetical protein
MNLFLAAVYTNSFRKGQSTYPKLAPREAEIVDTIPNILESYHYVGRQKYVDEMRADGAQVFLDSGAFSAWSSNVSISLPGYCDYILRNEDILRKEDGVIMASVLDGIGDPLQTYRNQLEMEARGVTPLPCFHFGEDERYLELYLAKYPYITLGGMVGKTVPQLITWLDRIWERYIIDGSGRPRAKFHAFGITSVTIMERYPWFSVDSSSWIQFGAYGSMFIPRGVPYRVSEKAGTIHEAGKHVLTLSPPERAYLDQVIAESGFDLERLTTIYEARATFNMWSYRTIADRINSEHNGTFEPKVMELF